MGSGNSNDRPTVLIRTSKGSHKMRPVVKIQVIDYGTGIPDEALPKVFDPFFTTKAPDKGTGLGLSISKTIIEQFGGNMDIESSSGHGTTVTITLPAEKTREDK